MVHGIRLQDGKAQWYRNRWIRTPAVARRLGEAAPRSDPHWAATAGCQHQRDRTRRPHACPGGGRYHQLRAHRRPGHRRPVRFRRHHPWRLHRTSQARPGHRGTARAFAGSTSSPVTCFIPQRLQRRRHDHRRYRAAPEDVRHRLPRTQRRPHHPRSVDDRPG